MTETSNDVQVDPEVLIATAGEMASIDSGLRSNARNVIDLVNAFIVDDLQPIGQGDEVLLEAMRSCKEALSRAAHATETLSKVVSRDGFALAETAFALQEADLKVAEDIEGANPGLSFDGGYR